MSLSGFPITRRSALVAMGAVAFARPGDLLAATPKRGGTMTFMLVSEPQTLVALTTVATPVLSVSAKVTEGLLDYDYDINPKPQLATEWSISPDGLSYTFKLRPGVKWHDGTPFTSADVAHSIQLLKTVHPRGRNTFANVATVETPEPLVAVFKLSKPAPYLIKALVASESPMLPKHIYEGSDPLANKNGNAPIGTGPFRFKEWVRGSHILYERNPDYWDAGKPYLDQVIVKFFPDAGARSIAFETGAADVGYRNPVSLGDFDRLKKVPSLKFTTDGTSYSYNVSCLQFNLDSEFFKHLKVRQAIAHAIDRKIIIRTALYGYAIETASPIAPGLKAYHDPSPSPYKLDLKQAEKLLDEAGFPRKDDKVRFRVPLDFNPIGGGEAQRISDYLRVALARIGVAVDVRVADPSAFTKRVYTDREFHFNVNGHSNLFDPTVGVQRLYWSKNFKKGVPFSNGSHYDNPRVDTLLEGAAVENDPVKRTAMFKEFQQIVMTELPDINLFQPIYTTIYNVRAQGHSLSAVGPEANFADAYIA